LARRRSESGGAGGRLADAALSKLGTSGKVASKLGMGSRLVERMSPGGGEPADDAGDGGVSDQAGSNGNGHRADATIPIQEAIEVAIPVKAAYSLCTGFEEYPEFLDRVESVERLDDKHIAFVAKVRGRRRRLEVEIVDERPNQRLDWRCAEGIEHSGVVSFHELAPRLTHIELTVDLEPEGLVERLTRSAHLSERAVRAELHRFKAHADLWEEEPEAYDDEEEPLDEEDLEDEPVDEEEIGDEEKLVDEEEFEDDPVDEEELVDEEIDDDDELQDEEEFEDLDEEEFEDVDELEDEELEDEELEPARAER
jgi:uncharacterized membrane protein